jgi:pentatricopeptide repeat protein
MLQQMKETYVKPGAIHYGAVINGWSRATDRDASNKAQALLFELEQAYKTSGYQEYLQPNIALYSAVVMAHARSGQPDVAEKAVALLKRVEELYNSTGDDAYRPDIVFYGGVLTALARTPGEVSLKMAEALLEDLEWRAVNGEEHLRPNIVCYTSLIFKLVKSKQLERAAELFHRINERYEASGDIVDRPDATVYAVLLEGWARSGKEHAANEVKRIISEMEALQASTGDDAFLPTVFHYTSLMNVYWKSNQPEKAEEILNFMEASTHVKPDVIAYTTVINAWGRSGHRNRATRAWNVLNRMKDAYQDGNVSAIPNVYSYTGVIQACIGLPIELRTKECKT